MIKQTPQSARVVWACCVVLGLFNSSIEAARKFIEFETQRDYANSLETFDTQILAVGRLRTQKGNDVTYEVKIELTFSESVEDIRHLYGGAPNKNQTIKRIVITIGSRIAVLESPEIRRICNPSLPQGMSIIGLKPEGLVINLDGPAGAEAYRCQIQADPRERAIVLIQSSPGPVGDHPIEAIASARFSERR